MTVFLNCIISFCFAQNAKSGNSIIKVYNNNTGLKYQSINQIVLDHCGFLWLGTNTGIVRFDGKNFVDFTLKDNRRFGEFYHSLPAGKVVVKDSKDWYYRLENGRPITDSVLSIQKQPFFYTNRNELLLLKADKDANIKKLIKDLDLRWGDNVYFITKNRDLYLHKYNSPRFYYLSGNKTVSKSLPASSVDMQFILRDTLYFLNQKGDFQRIYQGNVLPDEEFKSSSIKNFLTDYIKTTPFGLNLFNEFIYSDNNRAVFYYKNTIWQLQHTDKGFIMTPEREGLPFIRDISGIVYRKEDNSYFISSSSEGLYMIRPRYFEVLRSNLGIQNENNCMALMSIGKDSVLSARGIWYFGNKTVKTDLYLDPYALGKDENGQIYFAGTTSQYKQHSFYTSGPLLENRQLFADTIMSWNTCVKTNPWSREIYLSDYQFIYKRNGDRLEKILHLAVDNNHIINCFDFFDESSMIIGTATQVLLYNLKTKVTDSVLSGAFVRSIYIDKQKGYVWVGTYGKGCFIFKPGSKVIHLPTDKDENLSYVHNFLPDGKGFMWSGSNNGLYRYKINQVYAHIADTTKPVHYNRFDNTDGLATNELNGGAQPSVVRDNAGTAFISSIDGIIRFHPESIPVGDSKKEIYLQEILADDKELNPDSTLTIPHFISRIKFVLASSAIGNEKNEFLEYNIPSLSDKWLPVDDNNEISFNGLSHGRYTIVVRKETNDGYVYSEFPFEVLPAFYQTWWFYLIVVSLTIVILWIAYLQRVKWLTRKKIELEEIVKSKTISLNNTVDELTNVNKSLSESYRTIEKVTGIVLHDLRSPLKFLSVIAKKLDKNHDKLEKAELAEDLNLLHTTSVNTFLFTNDLLGWLMNNNHDLNISKIHVNVFTSLKEIADIYHPLIEVNQNDLICNLEKDLPSVTNPHLVGIIVRNALDNANKYTHNGKIELTAKRVADKIKISVSDNGKGFNIETLKQQLTKKEDSLKDTLGVKIIDDLAKKIGATYDFDSTIGVGTVFTLELDYVSETNV